MATVADIIKRALRSIKAIDPQETPTTQTYADSLETLNGMLKLWSASSQAIYAPNLVSWPVPAATTSFTIGSAGDIDTTRPKSILSGYLRDSGGNDYPLRVKAIEKYANIVLKSVNGLPENLYLRKGYPLWTVYFEVATDVAYTVYLELLQPLTTYTAVTDTFSAPGEYEDTVVYNLAVRLQPEYPVTDAFQLVAGLAKEAYSDVRNINLHPVPSSKADVPGGRTSTTNIYEG